MKFLKFVVCVLTIFTLLIFSYGYLNEHEVILTLKNIYSKNPTVLENNIYMEPNKNVNVEFATFTDNFIANSKDDLINIFNEKNLPQQQFDHWGKKVLAISKFSACEKNVLAEIVREIGENITH